GWRRREVAGEEGHVQLLQVDRLWACTSMCVNFPQTHRRIDERPGAALYRERHSLPGEERANRPRKGEVLARGRDRGAQLEADLLVERDVRSAQGDLLRRGRAWR